MKQMENALDAAENKGELDFQFEISDCESETVKQEETWGFNNNNNNNKRFSILDDFEELNKRLEKENHHATNNIKNVHNNNNNINNNNLLAQEEIQKKKKSSYSDQLMRKTLEFTYEYNQTGDKIVKFNLSDKDNPQQNDMVMKKTGQTVGVINSRYGSNEPKENSSEKKKKPKQKEKSKQTSCQTVIIKNPRMYKVVREINLLNRPEEKYADDFSHQLYHNFLHESKENKEYNLFSKAIQTERIKGIESNVLKLKQRCPPPY